MRRPWRCNFCRRGARWFIAGTTGCGDGDRIDAAQCCQKHKRRAVRAMERDLGITIVYRIVARRLVAMIP